MAAAWGRLSSSEAVAHVLHQAPFLMRGYRRIPWRFQGGGLHAARHPLLDICSDLHNLGARDGVRTRVRQVASGEAETINRGNLAWN